MDGLFTLSDFVEGILARKLGMESWGDDWHWYGLTFFRLAGKDTGREGPSVSDVDTGMDSRACGGFGDS